MLGTPFQPIEWLITVGGRMTLDQTSNASSRTKASATF
jgi:hypothetical protein